MKAEQGTNGESRKERMKEDSRGIGREDEKKKKSWRKFWRMRMIIEEEGDTEERLEKREVGDD